MNTDTLKGQWKQLKGEAKSRWGKLTDDDLQRVDGEFEKLVGIIQEQYGKGRDEAEKEAREWLDTRESPPGGPGGTKSV